MSDKQAEMLAKIGDGNVKWICVESTMSASPGFAGKMGWLRFMGEVESGNLVVGKLPSADDRVLMSGEWVDGKSSTRARMRADGMELKIISEDDLKGQQAVLRHEVEMLTRGISGDSNKNPKKYMRIAVYTGFRTKEDCEEGRLTTIAERFVGFSNDSLFGGAE
jgi:hypothetical protein